MTKYDQKVATVVEQLRSKGARVQVRRRKLVHRKKTYLLIKGGGTHHTFFGVVMPLISSEFPEAYMTSGGFWRDAATSEELMQVTVSLDPSK